MKSKLDNQNAFNSLSFMAEALIPLIDNLVDTNKPKHKLKFHINGMLEEFEKLSKEKYKAFKHADIIYEAKSVAINLYEAGSSQYEIVKFIDSEYGEHVAIYIKKFILSGMEHEERIHSYEDIMFITDKAYSYMTEMIHNRRANEIVSFVTVLKAFMESDDPERNLDNIITEYTPIQK